MRAIEKIVGAMGLSIGIIGLDRHLFPYRPISDTWFWVATISCIVVSGVGIISRRDWILWRKWWNEWRVKSSKV